MLSYEPKLDVEAKFDHIIRLHNIALALGADFSSSTRAGFRASGYKVVVIDNLRCDKSTFEVAMDNTSSLRSGCALWNSPGTDLFFAGGQIALQTQNVVRSVNKLLQTGFALAV